MTGLRPDQTEGLDGHRIRFRLVTVEDAAYIHALRTHADYSRHLSSAAPSVEAQQDWIASYKAREAAGLEYYFVIERRDDSRKCGLVRLYSISDGSFTWGSWILDHNKPAKAALESAVLVYQFAFGYLNCQTSVFDVRKDNERTLAFHRRFGAVETGSDQTNIYFEIKKADFLILAADLQKQILVEN